MGIVLDTSVLIEWERKIGALEDYATTHPDEPLGLSVITAAELLHGVHRADNAARRLKRSAFVEQAISSFPVYDVDLAVARLYAELWATLDCTGTRIGAHDLIIGATAISRGDKVLTLNRRDFGKIPGLSFKVL
ncbi:MAG: PIN domain-containing protein [Nitrospirae bacterium]|nr:PIN domain-containing protein [Nitrospirota bacterium]